MILLFIVSEIPTPTLVAFTGVINAHSQQHMSLQHVVFQLKHDLRGQRKLPVKKCFIKIFADEWIRTTDFWFWKRPLYQLSRNHWPR